MEFEYPRWDNMLLSAVQEAESAAILLRRYAAVVLPPESKDRGFGPAPDVPIDIQLTPEGWLTVTLPEVLPKRDKGDRAAFLRFHLQRALVPFREANPALRFHCCVLVYEFIYDQARNRRFIDHDNLELKHCQDVLETAFLINDTSSLCCAFQCSHRGEKDATRIWILDPEQFLDWLETHGECWR